MGGAQKKLPDHLQEDFDLYHMTDCDSSKALSHSCEMIKLIKTLDKSGLKNLPMGTASTQRNLCDLGKTEDNSVLTCLHCCYKCTSTCISLLVLLAM